MILVCKDGMRLCKDNMLRDCALYGTPQWTVRIYKSLGHARRTANRIGGDVAVIPEDMSVECTGVVIETKPSPEKPGWVTYVHHKLSDFFEKKLDNQAP